MIGRKQSTSNATWLDAMEHIEELVSEKDVAALEKDTVRAMKQAVKGKTAAYAWSGGKDSLVLAALCEKAGIKDSMFAYTDLEYPAFLDWCKAHAPDGCEMINVGLDLKWLSEHPEMLFPKDGRLVYRWFQIVQQTGIRQYFNEHKLDMIAVGHRTADGNYVGRGTNISSNTRTGVVRYAPIAHWTHEQVLAYIHYRNLPMPPIYGWIDGFRCGTHPWPARQYTESIEDGFRDVYAIDRDIVVKAAEVIPEARRFLEGVTK